MLPADDLSECAARASASRSPAAKAVAIKLMPLGPSVVKSSNIDSTMSSMPAARMALRNASRSTGGGVDIGAKVPPAEALGASAAALEFGHGRARALRGSGPAYL